MTLSRETTQLLDEIEKHAQGKLHYRNELGLLFELARGHGQQQTLDELTFFAKFTHKTHGIVKRIGKDAQGYDKLMHELRGSVEKCTVLIKALLDHAEKNVNDGWETTFFAMTPAAFQSLLLLLHDLSLYKNYSLDIRNDKGT